MRITCPECGFYREMPDDKVPATTAVATCPKCRHRFRFRHFEDGYDSAAPQASTADSGYSGEPEDAYRPRAGQGAVPRSPGAVRRVHEPVPDPDFGPSPGRMAPPRPGGDELSRPGLDMRRQERSFPPPSAHWEPAGAQDESGVADDSAPADFSAAPRHAPHPAAMAPPAPVPPGPPVHDEERLRVDVRDLDPPRPQAVISQDPDQDQNGVRDIWARLQAMDDEDEPRPAPSPRYEAPASARPQAPRQEPVRPDPGVSGDVSGAFRDEAPSGDDAPVRDGHPGKTPGHVPGKTPDEARADEPDDAPDGPSGPRDDRTRTPSRRDEPDEAPWRPERDPRGGEPAPGEIPWERPDAYGFFPGLVLTLKRILFQPVDFFESMPPGRGKGKALVFNLLLSEFLLLVDFLWALVGVRAKLADTGQTDALAAMAGVPGLGFLALLVMVPVLMAAGIFLDAGLTHLLLMLLRGSSRKFDETFRVMCYSAAPTVLSAVPVAGQLLSPIILIWYMTLQAIGLKKVHGAAYSQALAVVLIKWSLYLFLLLGMLYRLSSGA